MQTEVLEIRGQIRDLVSDLDRLDDRLAALCKSLPLPHDVAEMWEGAIPTNFMANLYSAIDAVRTDCIQDGMATLLHAVRQNEESLRHQWCLEGKRRILLDHHNPGDSAGKKETPLC